MWFGSSGAARQSPEAVQGNLYFGTCHVFGKQACGLRITTCHGHFSGNVVSLPHRRMSASGLHRQAAQRGAWLALDRKRERRLMDAARISGFNAMARA
jgi:hypothetical protein